MENWALSARPRARKEARQARARICLMKGSRCQCASAMVVGEKGSSDNPCPGGRAPNTIEAGEGSVNCAELVALLTGKHHGLIQVELRGLRKHLRRLRPAPWRRGGGHDSA